MNPLDNPTNFPDDVARRVNALVDVALDVVLLAGIDHPPHTGPAAHLVAMLDEALPPTGAVLALRIDEVGEVVRTLKGILIGELEDPREEEHRLTTGELIARIGERLSDGIKIGDLVFGPDLELVEA